MKIGILTVPFNNNYGGYLQCYALMSTLRKLGHEPVVINRRQNVELRLVKRIKAFVANRILGDKCRMYNKKSMEAYYALKGKDMYSFVDKNLAPMSSPLYRQKDYKSLESLDLDVVIVGSDQVWRPQYVPSIEEYFLEYVPQNVRKLAYAASFGSDRVEYSKQELDRCAMLLKSFYAISVREKSGMKIVKDYLGRNDVQTVLDPTMLLTTEDYCALMPEGCSHHKKHLFAYILDRTQWKEQFIQHVASNIDLRVLDIMKIGRAEPFKPIGEWLYGLKTSDFVVTDSFHGTVFCILFNRPFYVIGNQKRGNSRMMDLLSLFGLEDRLLNDGNTDFLKIEPQDNIKWEKVNNKLDLLRADSIGFLKHSLE